MVMFWYNSESMCNGSQWTYSIQAGNASIREQKNHIVISWFMCIPWYFVIVQPPAWDTVVCYQKEMLSYVIVLLHQKKANSCEIRGYLYLRILLVDADWHHVSSATYGMERCALGYSAGKKSEHRIFHKSRWKFSFSCYL